MLHLFDLSSVTFLQGMHVRAVIAISEHNAPFDARATRRQSGWEYARPGDVGRVMFVNDDGDPTVWFERSESATTAFYYELELYVPEAAPEGAPFPQAVDINSVIELVERADAVPGAPLGSAHVDAAIYLGFLQVEGALLTQSGRVLARADAPTRLALVLAALERSPVFRRGLVGLLMTGTVPEADAVLGWFPDQKGHEGDTVRGWLSWVVETGRTLLPPEPSFGDRPTPGGIRRVK